MEVHVINDDYDLYRIQLGDFLMNFAGVEEIVYDLMVKFSGVDPIIAPAIFGGTRINECMATIKRIHEARGIEMDEGTKKHFRRLQEITSIRNNVVHHSVTFEWSPEGIATSTTVSNARVAHMPSKVKEMEIGPKILYGLVKELQLIGLVLWKILHPEIFDRAG